MKVYHGSVYIVKEPDLAVSDNKTDFGKGFYTTKNLSQAENWTRTKKNRALKEGTTEDIHQYINVYEYEEIEELKILNFESASEEWLNFVLKNRNSETLSHKYDIVTGPVADDNLYQVLALYENGVYDVKETVKRLKTYLLANQISFHTEKALKCIKYIETIEVKK